MSEFDAIADELVYVIEPVEHNPVSFYPQDVIDCSPASQLIQQQPAPLCGDVTTSSSSQNTDVTTVRLRHRPPASALSVTNHRGSFYTSGTLSASASRDHSPNDTLCKTRRQRQVRRICDYPLAPPSMIITPSRTPMRSQSSDRSTTKTFNASELMQRLSYIVDCNESPAAEPGEPMLSAMCRSRSAHKMSDKVYAGAHHVDALRQGEYHTIGHCSGRSSAVTPRTVRRQFYEQYPTTTGRQYNMSSLLQQTRDVAPLPSSEMAVTPSLTSQEGGSNCSSSKASRLSSQLKKTKNRMSMLRLPTLPFFRRKQSNESSNAVGPEITSQCSLSSSSDVMDVSQQQSGSANLKSTKDRHLSRSQPLHTTNLVTCTSFDTLTSTAHCHGNVAQLPPSSAVTKTTSHNVTGLAARFIDPLKKRRQRITSAGDLPVVVTSSSKEITSVMSLGDLPASHHASRPRRRHMFSSALMQGSL